MNLYHRDNYWLADFDNQVKNILNENKPIVFSHHVQTKPNIDILQLHNIIVSQLKIKDVTPFEVETDENNTVCKFVIRTSYNFYKDICIVLLNQPNCLFVKTAWLNNKYDLHETLDKTRYSNYRKENEV